MVTIQSQNFGVEIEMTGVSRGTAASVIANYFGVGGYPLCRWHLPDVRGQG